MATPQERTPQPDIQPELRLIPGGLALEQTVEVRPSLPPTFAEFSQTLGEPGWSDMSAEELLRVRESISDYTGELALLIHNLQQEFDAATRKKIWINGFIRDRL